MGDNHETKLLDGKAMALQIKDEIANEVRAMTSAGRRAPHLAAVIVGEDGASMTYVASKEKSSHEVGFTSSVYRMSEQTTERQLLETIDFLNNDPDIDGFIVQLPLPKHIDEQKVINAIAPDKDVDGFTPVNVGRMVLGEECFVPATPMGLRGAGPLQYRRYPRGQPIEPQGLRLYRYHVPQPHAEPQGAVPAGRHTGGGHRQA